MLGKPPHSARNSWVYIDGEVFQGVRADISGDPEAPWLNIAWKYLYTAKDTWLRPNQGLGSIGALYNLTMDPYEKYDMIFNGAVPTRTLTTSPGRYASQDNGWVAGVLGGVTVEFDKSIMKYPSIMRAPGGASTDLVPNLQRPNDPLPLMKTPRAVAGSGG